MGKIKLVWNGFYSKLIGGNKLFNTIFLLEMRRKI